MTYPASTGPKHKSEQRLTVHRPKPRGSNKAVVPDSVSPAFHMWQVLNPSGHDLIHIRMESPAILFLYDDTDVKVNDGRTQADERDKLHHWARFPWLSRLWSRTMRPLAWITKIVLIPITVTTAALYGLLLYLLKDADLLEAQRNRPESDAEDKEEVIPPVEGQLSFTTLPRAFIADVDLIATSKDGSVVVSISLQNEFALWKTRSKMWTTIDTSDILLGSGTNSPSPATTLTAVAMDDKGSYCAVGTGGGIIALWSIGGDVVKPLPHLIADNQVSSVTAISFAPSLIGGSGQATPRRSTSTSQTTYSTSPDTPDALYAAYENGSVIKWTMSSFAVPSYITPSRSASVSKAFLLRVQGGHGVLVAFALDDGTLDIRDVNGSESLPHGGCVIPAGNPFDLVSRVHVCSVEIESGHRVIIAATTQAGVVSLWDGQAAECLHIMEEPFGDITRLRVTPGCMKVCSTCGELPYESFTVSFSTGQAVLFYRAYLFVPSRRCSCVHNQPNHQVRSSVLGRRSRSSSAASTTNGTVTPSHPHQRSRLSSFSSATSSVDTSMFPVSGHGIHSRRASDKDSLRRNLDTFLAAEHDDSESPQPIGPQDPTNHNFLSSESRSALWQNLIVTRMGDATCERGGWEVANGKIVGIRRRPRIPFANGRAGSGYGKDVASPPSTTTATVQVPNRSSAGLSPSALERWEFWTFNPYDFRLEASTLVALGDKGASFSSSAPPSPTTLPPQPLKRLNGAVSSTLSVPSSSIGTDGGLKLSDSNARSSTASNAIPRLHFTRVSPFTGDQAFCAAGFGNTIGMFAFCPQGLNGNASATSSPSILPRQPLKSKDSGSPLVP